MLNNKNLKNKNLNMNVQNIKEREKICRNCPIFNPNGEICNPKLWINPDTNESSTTSKSGYIKGCGCHVMFKMKNINSHCIAGKW